MATVNIYDMTDTWNDGATTFAGIKMNVTDTASAAASKLLDLQVGGVSNFFVRKDGVVGIKPGVKVTDTVANPGASPYFEFGGSDNGRYINFMGGFWASWLHGIVVETNYGLSWGSASTSIDLSLMRDAANMLAQRRGTNPQTFNIYNTCTDASNYERLSIKWDTNVVTIAAEAAGTGTKRNLVFDGANRAAHIADVSSGTDSTYETAINAIIAALEGHGITATS